MRERRLFWGSWPELPARRALCLPSGRCVAGVGAAMPDARDAEPGSWLLDPDVAVTVAGLVGDLARRDDLRPLHPKTAYLLGSAPNAGSPGTWLWIDALLPPKPKALNAWLAANDVGQLTIRKRGVGETAEHWRRRLRPAGHAPGTLVFTRDRRERMVVLACLDTARP